MLKLYKPMQILHWKRPTGLQGTTKLKMGSAAASRQVKETQSH